MALRSLLSPSFLLQHGALSLGSLHFVWAGSLLSISFMEAWVKFHAPTVKREQALDVGRHVFSALNTLEILFGCSSLALVTALPVVPRELLISVASLVSLVYAEGFYFIPRLSERIHTLLTGGVIKQSPLHALEVSISLAKLGLVFYSAVNLVRR